MSYQVLARKWRPKNFVEVVGQEHVTRALINALNQNRLHHAYLFTGTRGVGKTTLARIFAKSLNCEHGVTAQPCGQCQICKDIDSCRFIDLIEVDAASRTKVEDTRELLDNVQYAPTSGRYKIYLIDELHMLSGHSFNALLKTLEEPPPHVKFLLATTDPQKLPITILSRCLQFNLKKISPEKISQHLSVILNAENVKFETEALRHLARAANGSIRDALSLLDQAIAFSNSNISNSDVSAMLGTIEATHLHTLLTGLVQADATIVLTCINNLSEQAADFDIVLEELLTILHQIALAQYAPGIAANSNWNNVAAITEFARKFSQEEIQLYYQIALIGRRDLPLAATPKSGFEMIMLRMLAFQPANCATLPARNNQSQSIAKIPKSSEVQAKSKEWPEIFQSLNLSAPTKALASHCNLKCFKENIFTLQLHTKYAPLLNQKHKQNLTEALGTYFQKPIQLTIEIISEEMTTPNSIAVQKNMHNQQIAEKSINNDSNVQKLMQEFNATIVPGSVRAVENDQHNDR